jgi:hypothetical protein
MLNERLCKMPATKRQARVEGEPLDKAVGNRVLRFKNGKMAAFSTCSIVFEHRQSRGCGTDGRCGSIWSNQQQHAQSPTRPQATSVRFAIRQWTIYTRACSPENGASKHRIRTTREQRIFGIGWLVWLFAVSWSARNWRSQRWLVGRCEACVTPLGRLANCVREVPQGAAESATIVRRAGVATSSASASARACGRERVQCAVCCCWRRAAGGGQVEGATGSPGPSLGAPGPPDSGPLASRRAQWSRWLRWW